MKIGLASYECRMNDIGVNLKQIEKAIVESKDADLVCFGEAFLQGFTAVTSDYEMDIKMAAEQDSLPVAKIRELSLQYRKAVMVGYIEKDGPDIYSSYALIEGGSVIHNYRRISKNGYVLLSVSRRSDDRCAVRRSVDLSGILPVQRPADLAGLCEF